MSKNIFKFLSRKLALRLLLLITILSIPILYHFDWSGFGKDSYKSKNIEKTIRDGKTITLKETEIEHIESEKTFWDWLELSSVLAIPIVLHLFQTNEQRRADKRAEFEKEQAEKLAKNEKDIAEANLREDAFQIYIDKMSQLLINKKNQSELFDHKYKDNPVKDIVRVRTTTILRRLEKDIERQYRIFHFLGDTELLPFLLSNANLSGLNLSALNFPNINFTKANLSEANLSEANLSGANLSKANLSGANLSKANLSGANLYGANFTNANLSNANLKKSHIQDTTFINTDLSNAILESARTWYFPNNELDELGEEFTNEEDLNSYLDQTIIEKDGKAYIDSYDIIFYEADFSGAILTKADLKFANFIGAKNLTPEQLQKAKNWNEAIYHDELPKFLGLPIKLQIILDNIGLEGKDVAKTYWSASFSNILQKEREYNKYRRNKWI